MLGKNIYVLETFGAGYAAKIAQVSLCYLNYLSLSEALMIGVKSGIIICGIRHISPEASLKLADLCVKFKNDGVVGFEKRKLVNEFYDEILAKADRGCNEASDLPCETIINP